MDNYLALRRKDLNLTQLDIANMVGVSEGTVSRWESGAIANMRRDRILAYAKALHATPNFIMTGTEDDPPSNSQTPAGFQPLPAMEKIPLVGRIACGEPILAEQNFVGQVSVFSGWNATFALMCAGDSMAPTIQDGDIVAIHTQPEVENGQIAAVRIGDEATLKRVYLYPNYMELRPENPQYQSIIKIGEEMADVHIEGRAIGLCRTF